jgi:hypothetical protein
MAQQHGEQITPATVTPHPAHHATKGFVQTFGLSPMVALLTLCVDQMLFASELATLGIAWILSLVVSIAVAVLSYRAQMRFYGDDSEAAMIKAGCLGLLVAIPTGLPLFIYAPLGFVGLFRRKG